LSRSKLSIFGFYVLLLCLCGCSTTNHGILPSQAYHDITSHYNAYFNANEKLKNTLRVQRDTHKDKFDSVIAVYDHNNPSDFAANSADLDDAIKRSTLSIQLHGTSNWSDDNMLLIGKSSYLKGDYDKASSSFRYITTEYKDGVDYVKVRKSLGKKVGNYVKAKKKKKKTQVKVVTNEDGTKTLEKIDNRPKKSIWVHTPARSEALIWLIKTYTRQKKYEQAGIVVTYVRGDDFFYKNYDPELDLADADLQVSEKDYNGAITPLEKYLTYKKVKKKKRKKVRPLFVLAQCYEQTGNYAKAIENYKAVLKSNPNDDMEFYAKLKMAKLGRKGASDNAAIRNLLTKMSKDGKYKEYWDQIFYELALISISENDNLSARKFLRKSIDKSVSNDDQKAVSFLQLAVLDYDAEQYVAAKFNYDTTLTLLAKNDERYPDIEQRNKVLDNLVRQLNIIAEEDSLQRLASLPEDERQKIVKSIIAKQEEEEENKKNEIENVKQQQEFDKNRPQNSTSTTVAQPNPQAANSTWYFYNTAARATGYNNFIQKWGRRKLEENWRRKDKSSASADEENVVTTDSTKEGDKMADDSTSAKTPEEKLLAGIPTSPEKLKKSNDRLIDAYFTAGTIYKDGLENYPKAKEMFEALNKRFDNHKLLLESLYYLYLIEQKNGNTAQTDTYKNLIISAFPESVIAKILRDPYFVNATKKQENELNNYYEGAFADYKENRLDSAWYKCKMSDVAFKVNPLSAKFELLLALVLSKQNKLEEYVQSLQKLSNKSTDTEVKKTASDLLSLLNKSTLPQIDLSKDTTRRDSINSMFSPKPDTSAAALLQQLNEVKQQAKDKGAVVVTDTAAKKTAPEVQKEDVAGQTAKGDTVPVNSKVENVVVEDTTSVYVRSDAAVHYCIVYVNDPAVTSAIMVNTLAKVQAFNSTQYESSKLQTKQIVIDSKNKLLNVKQFKSGADAMAYYKVLVKQAQLFDELKKEQYSIAVISTMNFGTLLGEKDIAAYLKFMQRVYK
jgi:tetratricopeptide (TPR) repeat protein